jgi:hypothetical protein
MLEKNEDFRDIDRLDQGMLAAFLSDTRVPEHARHDIGRRGYIHCSRVLFEGE